MKNHFTTALSSLLFMFILSTFASCGSSCEDTCDNGICDLDGCECFTGWTGINCDQQINTGGGNCNFTSYYGTQDCNDNGYVKVSSTACCPPSYPYYNSTTGHCYTSCSSAYNAAQTGYITYGTGQTTGSSSGYDCSGSSCYSVSSNASYSTQSVCESYCGSTNTSGYNCTGSTCYYTSSNATYSSQSICNSYCNSSSGVGEISFYTMSDLGCGTITVNVSGYASKSVSSFYSSGITNCNNTGCANYNLPPGSYSYTASCNGYSWGPLSFTITDGGCLKYRLQ